MPTIRESLRQIQALVESGAGAQDGQGRAPKPGTSEETPLGRLLKDWHSSYRSEMFGANDWNMQTLLSDVNRALNDLRAATNLVRPGEAALTVEGFKRRNTEALVALEMAKKKLNAALAEVERLHRLVGLAQKEVAGLGASAKPNSTL